MTTVFSEPTAPVVRRLTEVTVDEGIWRVYLYMKYLSVFLTNAKKFVNPKKLAYWIILYILNVVFVYISFSLL